MDDLLLQQAIERRDRLRAELSAVEQFIQSLLVLQPATTPQHQQADLFAASSPRRNARAIRSEAVSRQMDAAERYILDAGRPLSRGALLHRIEQDGIIAEGGDKSKVLGTNLWRSRRFHNLKGAGYWPKSHPIPAAFAHLEQRDTSFP